MSIRGRPRGRRPTSPASSSSASSASSDDDDSTQLNLVGTPIDTTERHYRTLRQQRHQQQQPTQREAAGFTPAVFVSSRQRRWQGDVATVEEYMDDKDGSEQTRDRLQVKAAIEGGRGQSKGGGGDALLLAIAPRHETVARRILRRMGWKEGRAVGRERPASTSTVGRVSAVRRGPLPPSMQAMLDEDEEETKNPVQHHNIRAHYDETKDTHEAFADDDSADDDTPLPSDVPSFHPPLKDDFYGLGYDPLHNAEEFATHKTKQLQERRRREEAARDAALMEEDDGDDVVELVRGGAGRGGRGGRGRGGVAGFRLMNDDDEMDDDEVEVYEDKAEYDTHIGRLKRDTKQKERDEQKKEEAEAEGGGGCSELVFVKGEVGGVSGGEAANAWEVPREWNERKVWDEAEEATERARMKAEVREWADGRRAQMRARLDEVRQMQRLKDEQKDSSERQQQEQQLLASPAPPPPTAPLPVQTTADMLASGFFSRFTMAASTAAPSPSSALPLPPPPPPAPLPVTHTSRQLKREVLVWDPSPILCRRLGVEPPPRRENVTKSTLEQPTSRSNTNTLPANKQKRKQRQHNVRAANELAEVAAELHAPVIVTERPPTAVLSAIFDDVDDRGEDERARMAQQQWLEAEAMRLLSSISLPSNDASSLSAPSSASSGLTSASGVTQSAVSGYVHPSRQQQVQTAVLSSVHNASTNLPAFLEQSATLQSLSSPFVPAGPTPTVSGFVHPSRLQQLPPASHLPVSAATHSASPALTATPAVVPSNASRRSRWGDKVGATAAPPPMSSSTPLSPSSSPPPLGPPTPPSLRRPLPQPAPTTSTAATVLTAGSEEQKAALKAELLKELAMLEQQSEREKKEKRREKRHKDRKRERRRSRSSGRNSSGRREGEGGRHSGREKRSGRRSRRSHGSDSESRSSGSSVRNVSPPRSRTYSKRETDVVDLT